MIYAALKLVHLAAVIVFLGNILTSLFWMRLAVHTKEPPIIAHTIRGIIKSGRLFTVPGVILITLAGFLTAIYGGLPILHTGWILWSIVLFSLSGLVFGAKVVPLQRKMHHLTQDRESAPPFDWIQFYKLYRRWEFWGGMALLTPAGALIMMTLKIPR